MSYPTIGALLIDAHREATCRHEWREVTYFAELDNVPYCCALCGRQPTPDDWPSIWAHEAQEREQRKEDARYEERMDAREVR